MYEGNRFNSPLVQLKRMSPLIWAIILLIFSGIFAFIPWNFFKILSLFFLLGGGLIFYQAIFNNKY